MPNPQVIEDLISIAASSTNDNVISSNASLALLLNTQFAGRMFLLATQSATGLRISLDHGSSNVVKDSDVRVGTDLEGQFDLISDGGYVQEGEQLVLRVVNTTVGALSLRYRIIIVPMAEPGSGQLDFAAMGLFETRTMQRGPVSIANGTNDGQQLTGLAYERPPRDCEMEVFMTASATGMTRQVNVGSQRIAPPSSIAPLNRIPRDPQDSTIDGIGVPARNKIELSITNNTGGALNLFWRIKLQELN
jgi:hypothetical protein